MNNLSDEILLIIFSYVGPNTIYFNKGFLNYLNKLKKEFKKSPLKIKYQLIEWKKKFKEDLKYRPSMRINQFNEINLEGEIYIGDFNYQDNTINFSKAFEDKVIPLSYIQLSESPVYKGYVVYWTINTVICNDTKDRMERYSLLWNKY